MTALLHDTIEDTTTDRDDLIELFGAEVADWVSALSKDKRLLDDEREAAYMRTLVTAPPAVKICKLADIFDNLLDSQHLSGVQRQKTLQRSKGYLACLQTGLSELARPAFQIVSELFTEVENASRGA
jgi:guanosine-3',5'-bis(diphosphate) 3'-pyrophosphohydrolase